MADIDAYASRLLETSRRFFEKAKTSSGGEAKEAHLTAALLIGFSALEAHLNAGSEEMMMRDDLTALDKSILSEKDFRLEKGEFVVLPTLKIYRLEDRLQFLFHRFGKATSARGLSCWSDFQAALDLRNRIVHPKEKPEVTEALVQRSLASILALLNDLYGALFRKGLPGFGRGLTSTMTF